MSEEENNSQENTLIIPKVIDDEMKSFYLSYAMSVIVGRALPDVRDGLKPVHRRILFAMNDLGLNPSKSFKKSARIVGEVLGKYHPHGDGAVYDAMVRMVQSFSLRYPLVRGQGNFGSIDGDNAAAMRYTEAKMQKLADDLLQDIDKETIDFSPNFDGSLEEPTVLPAKVPNLLINGSSGIAVGMATNMPPHNLTEVCQGVIKVIDNPEIDCLELMETVTGPDFPTGGIICGDVGIKRAYTKGRGKLKVRGKLSIEEDTKKPRIIITEIPFQVNKSLLLEEIANQVKNKTITAISDLRDESDKDGLRIVIELKSGANAEVVVNQLYKHTRLQVTFGIINLCLVNNEPKVLDLRSLLGEFINHRKEVIRRRTAYDLRKAEERSHILEGLIVALDDIDNAIRLIKQSKSADEAKTSLKAHFKISDIQTQAILDMKLQRLTSLEQHKIRDEQEDLLKKITEFKSILASEERILSIIKEDMELIVEKYGDERRTIIAASEDSDLEIEDLIKPEDVVVSVTHSGYIKSLAVDTYKLQRRGGRGVIGTGKKEEDVVEHLFVANNHDTLLIFTNIGKVHWIKVHRLPVASRTARGTPIVNLLSLGKDERATAFIPVKVFDDNRFLAMATKNGNIKKTALSNFAKPRRGGILAIGLRDDDELMSVLLTNGEKKLLLATKNGMAVRFKEKDVRPMGRSAGGVRGVRLKGKDQVVSMVLAPDEKALLTVTEKGYGKRTNLSDYRLISRGGSGVINIQTSDRNGAVVSVRTVEESDHVMLMSKDGIIIRSPISGISVIGRNTQGVRLMRLGDEDAVVAAAIIKNEDAEGESEGLPSPEEAQQS